VQVTTLELVKRAAAAADMHDNFVTPAVWMYWATQEHLALALFLARSGWTQNVKTTTITVTGSEAGVYALAVDPLAIVAVHQVRDNRYRRVHLNNVADFLRQTPGSTVAKGDPIDYRVIWDQDNDELELGFYPEPSTGSVFIVSYVPEPIPLTLTDPAPAGYSLSVKYPMGWEERIVLGLARRALAKEESDTREVIGQIKECEQRIEEAVWNRVLTEHPTVRNLDRESRGWTERLVYPSPSAWWFV
jgi:hypothetical protein